ncbi:TrmH family RNA methyltransferase [Kiritimatiella glycovorans]|uniref:TrmH family tRNA/rRNA methyltransferase n=1 Tax=Kiritimatiella glycovorans TaxID=1307763 RepID=A0A0G3EDL2_9BACT|nr:RNA methyltransferase [Kiritimatiella glycovorans]AKJ64408.1 Putative TrmH family tRNA/rRNA methyltransferase [Kiritimatiella glycovorans]
MTLRITSANNPRFKRVRSLGGTRKPHREEHVFLLESPRAIAALEHDRNGFGRVRELWFEEGRGLEDRWSGSFEQASRFSLPAPLFSRLTSVKNSQGILAVVEYMPPELRIHDRQGRYVVLDGLGDPGNMGTLIRTAVAAGVDAILLHGPCADPFNPKCVRASMGMLPLIGLHRASEECWMELERGGYDIVGLAAGEGENLFETAFPPCSVVVLGHEAHGLSSEARRRCSRMVHIPMRPACESLNAAVAGALAMYATRRV